MEKDAKGPVIPEVAAAALPEIAEMFEWNTRDVEIVKGNQNRSGGWLHGPAMLECFKAATERLHKLLAKRAIEATEVTKVRVARLKGTKRFYIFPTDERDHEGIKVHRYASTTWINLITVLSPHAFTVPTGFQDRFALDWAEESHLLGPALVLDLDKQLERRVEVRKKKSSGKSNKTEANKASTPETTETNTEAKE